MYCKRDFKVEKLLCHPGGMWTVARKVFLKLQIMI